MSDMAPTCLQFHKNKQHNSLQLAEHLLLFKAPSPVPHVKPATDDQLHLTGEQTEVWETKGPAGLKRKDSVSTTCLHAILRKGC